MMVRFKEHEVKEVLKMYESLKFKFNEKLKDLRNNKEKLENIKSRNLNMKKIICKFIKENKA